MPSIAIIDLTNAKTDVDHIALLATSPLLTATDRLGNVKLTMQGAIDTLKAVNNRGAWAAAAVYALKDLALSGGTWYFCVVAHTSSAAFATDTASKWRVYQGVVAGDLSAVTGATLIGTGDGTLADYIISKSVRVVDSVQALRSIPATAYTRATTAGYRTPGDGGQNSYYYDPTDTSSAENGGSVIVGLNGARWKALDQRNFSILQWGARGDGTTDDYPAIQAAINTLAGNGVPLAGATCGKLTMPPERVFKISSTLTLFAPIVLDFQGTLSFPQTTGTAIRIGTGATWSNGYDIFIRNLIGPGGASPTTVNATGARGVLVTSMTFSKLEIRSIYGFSLVAVDLQAYGDFGYQQVVQHNDIRLGQIANNGYGLRMRSLDAASSSAQANLISIQNIYQNAGNILIDDSGTTATNSNTFRINAMDNVSAGSTPGIGLDLYGKLNDFWIGFTGRPGTNMVLRSNSYGNTVRFGNTPETDIIITYGGTNNRVICAPPTTGQLPATGVTVTSGTLVQNTYGVPITVYLGASGTAGSVFRLDVGPQSAQVQTVQTLTLGSGSTMATLRVPAGGWWRAFSISGTVNYAAAAFQDAS